jgi:hypothetical protein
MSDRTFISPKWNPRNNRPLLPLLPDEREMFTLLDLIAAEFRSDPMSTACFDARIVERVKAVVQKYREQGHKP